MNQLTDLPDEVLLYKHPLPLVQMPAAPVAGEVLPHSQAPHRRLERQREGDLRPRVGHHLVEAARQLQGQAMLVDLCVTHRFSAWPVSEYLRYKGLKKMGKV